MPRFREEAYILTGIRRGRVWLMRLQRQMEGTPASVETDWHWATEREKRSHDVAGFYHTHPPAAGASPSQRDVRTMRAWCSSFGKPMLCVIVCEGRAQSTLFRDDEDSGLALPVTELFAGGIIVAVEKG